MFAFGRSGVRRVLQRLQRLAILATVEQDCAEPRLGVGVACRERPQLCFRPRQIAVAIGFDWRPQFGGDTIVTGTIGLRVRRQARGEQCRKHGQPRQDHLSLKVYAVASALAFSISSGFSSCESSPRSWAAFGTFQRSAIDTHL